MSSNDFDWLTGAKFKFHTKNFLPGQFFMQLPDLQLTRQDSVNEV